MRDDNQHVIVLSTWEFGVAAHKGSVTYTSHAKSTTTNTHMTYKHRQRGHTLHGQMDD